MKIYLIKISILLFSALLLFSCKKNDKDTLKPVVISLEIGLNNSHESHRGSDIHLEFEVTDDEELGFYTVEIEPDFKAASDAWNFQNRWDFAAGMRNVLVHSHEIAIPAEADMGVYSFKLTIGDHAGNLVVFDEAYTVLDVASGNGPEIHVENYPAENQLFENGETISVSGHVHSEFAHIAGIFIGIVSEEAGLADSLVDASNALVLYHQHNFEAFEVEYNASLAVGAVEDNNYPAPNPISNWNLGESYLLIKAVDENGSWSFSQHYHINISTK